MTHATIVHLNVLGIQLEANATAQVSTCQSGWSSDIPPPAISSSVRRVLSD